MKIKPRLSRAIYSHGVPLDLDSAIVELFRVIGPNGVKSMKMKSEERAVIEAHNSIGQWIRNNWKLWIKKTPLRKWFGDIGVKHPDDMSAIVVRSAHRYLMGSPLEIESQVEKLRAYWESKGINPDSLEHRGHV